MTSNTKSNTIQKCIATLAIFLCTIIISNAATITSTATGGPWESTTTWATGVVPAAGDNVIIASGANVSVNTTTDACASLTLNTTATATTFTIGAGDVLTVSGAVTFNAQTSAVTKTFAIGTGTLNAGSIIINGGTLATRKNLITINGGTLNCTGNFTFNSGSIATSAVLQWLINTSTVTIGGNLTCSSSAYGELQVVSSCNMSVAGNYSFQGAITNASYLNLTMNGTSAQTISGTCNFRSLIINNSAGVTAGSAININGATTAGLSISTGTLDLSIYQMTTVTPAKLFLGIGTTLKIGGSNDSLPTFSSFSCSGSTIQFYGTNQNLAAGTYGNVTFSGPGNDTILAGASKTKATVITGSLSIADNSNVYNNYDLTVDGTTTVGAGLSGSFNFISTLGTTRIFIGLVTINSGATWNNTVGRASTFRGGITNNGTFTVGGTGVQTFNTNAQTLTGNFSMPKVTVTGISLKNTGTLTVTSALAGTGGLLNASGATITIDTTPTIDTIDAKATGNTVIFNGTTTLTIPAFNYYNLTVSGTAAITLGTNHNIGIAGTFTPGTNTYSTNGSTVNFNGTSPQTIPAFNFYGLTASGTGTKTFAGIDSIKGNLSITNPAIVDLGSGNSYAYTLTYGTTGQNPGSYGGTGSAATNINSTYFAPVSTGILNVAAIVNSWIGVVSTDWNNPSNWSYGTVPDSTTNVAISSTPPYQPVIGNDTIAYCNNITINSGDSLTISGTDSLVVRGNFSNSGKFISNTSTVIFDGTNQIVGGTKYYNLILERNGLKTTIGDTVNGTLTLEDSAFVSNAPIYGSAASLEYNTYLARTTGVEWITPFTATGGITIANTGVIRVGAAKAINATSLTVNSGATLDDTIRVISGTGTFNLLAGATLEIAKTTGINGCFTITNVLLNPAANYVFLQSTAAMNTGAYLTAAGNITLQNIAFGTTLTSNVVVTGTFTVKTGAILTAGSNVISGSGVFSLQSGATIRTTNTTGLDGTITTSGLNHFDPAANYTFNGTIAQTTGLTMPSTINNLNINNVAGVTLSNPTTVDGILTLTNGLLTTTTTNLLTVNDTLTTSVVAPSSTSYVNGPMNWNLSSGTAYTYPIGNGTSYYPFTITPTGTLPQVQAQAFNSNCGGTPDNITVHSLSNTEYWYADVASGSLTGAIVGLTRPSAISPLNVIATSATVNGTYSTLHGTPTINSINNSDNTVSLGYFVMGGCSNTGDTTAVACSSFKWYGTVYSSSGTPTQILTNKAGCDSTLTLHLTINNPTTGDTTASACSSFKWYGNVYTSSGTPTQILTNKAGCDSTLTLHLTINNPTTGDTTASACSSFTWYGTTYTSSATPTHMFTDKEGCDSTLTLHLTINNPTTGDTTASACSSFKWYGNIYTSSGTPTQVLIDKEGCDSTLTLHLTINNPTTGDTTASACSSFKWYGNIYTSSGTPTQVLIDKEGCDSTLTLHLTINNPTKGDTTASACSSFKWYGNIYTSSGTPTQALIDKEGCDSTLTLHLTINNPTKGDTTASACSSFKWYGNIYTSSGTPTQALIDKEGCDSTLTLHLTINNPTTGDTTASACSSFKWYGNVYTSSGTPAEILTNKAGCDSTLTLHLTINNPTTGDTTASACSSFKWYGNVYTSSGTPAEILTNKAGCDSTLTLHLTINTPTTGDTTASACNSFKWYGNIYTSSGTPTQLLTDKEGCDSTLTLHLTINTPTTGDTTASACGSFKWYGNVYTSSGTPTEILTNKAGCDSTLTLHLTINTPTTGDTTASACGSFKWYGNVYTSSGTPTEILTNKTGCDSTLTLHLTIHNPTTGDTTASACNSFKWYGNIYTSSGTPTQLLTDKEGCDSTLTLNLTITPTPTVTITGTSNINIGSRDTLTAKGATTYSWSSGSLYDTTIVSPLISMTYTVTGTTNGCSGVATFSVTVVPTGINSIMENTNTELYPNPANNELNLVFNVQSLQSDNSAEIKIIDLSGKEIMTQKALVTNGKTITLNIQSLPQGFYFVRVLLNNNEQVVSFIKQ